MLRGELKRGELKRSLGLQLGDELGLANSCLDWLGDKGGDDLGLELGDELVEELALELGDELVDELDAER
jgi:hypothetical protein